MLPAEVLERDRALEEAHIASSLALMEHRWHWTLDASNVNRVSLREYARQVNRVYTTIRRCAAGYAIYKEAAERLTAQPLSPQDAREHARVGAGRRAAIQAMADKEGISFLSAANRQSTHRAGADDDVVIPPTEDSVIVPEDAKQKDLPTALMIRSRLLRSEIKRTRSALFQLISPGVLGSLRPRDVETVRAFIGDVRGWADQVEAELRQPPRLVARNPDPAQEDDGGDCRSA